MFPTPKKILIMRLGGIGEVLTITPALRAIRKHYADAKITLLAESPASDILRGQNLVDHILNANAVYRTRGIGWLFAPAFPVQLFRLIGTLARERFDLFLCFQHYYYPRSVLKPLLVSLASGARVRVGFDSYQRGFFLTHKVRDARFEERHLLYRNQEFLEALGIPAGTMEASLVIEESDRTAARELLGHPSPRRKTLRVGVNPGSSRPTSRWAEDRFCALIKKIIEEHRAQIVLVGTPGEQALCERVRAAVGESCVNLAGKTTLGQLCAVIEQCDLFVTNDSGPLHIAQALKIPTVGIFGPGEYAIWGTYRQNGRYVSLREPVWCSPCTRFTCSHHTCMRLIDVDTAYAAVKKMIP